MENETIPAGKYRQKIYDAVQTTIGRNLTDNEHKYLSSILKQYVAAHAPTVPLNQKPIEHHFICPECLQKKVTIGHSQSKPQMQKARKRQSIANKIDNKSVI